ncbi:MAG: 2-dehydro-3-deoxygalactonokinase [Trueperaceae bacterium]
MTTYAVVDSGTTTTRVRLWRDGAQVWSGSRSAGARDTAVDGNNAKLRAALRELLADATSAAGGAPDGIVCSGMITSNMGLWEVPHLVAPAGSDDIARGVVQQAFPELSPIPFSFVPGVKTRPASLSLTNLAEADVLRGEEAEIVGLRAWLGLTENAVFLHLGSHHKAIDVDAEGRILASRTAITGELLAAVRGHTILKSSVEELEGLDLDMDAAMAGAEATRRHGLGRASFLVRVGEQIAGLDKVTMTSYLVGALAQVDLPLLEGSAWGVANPAPVVLYGGGHFHQVLVALIEGTGREVRTVDPEAADAAAVRGALALFERSRELGVAR